AHQVGLGVNGLQPIGQELGRPHPPGAAGEVEGDDPLVLPRLPLAGSVGVKGQVEVIVPRVGGADGGGGGHVGGVADVLDPRGIENGLHVVGQVVHPLLFGAQVVGVVVVLLGGRGQIDDGQDDPSFFPILCPGGGGGAPLQSPRGCAMMGKNHQG